MTADIRWLWTRLNSNYWFYPALFSIAGAVLAFTLVWLDQNGFAEWLSDMKFFTPARPDGASNMLTVIAGSMIGVASTVFSITIAAVAYASGNYGPRLLTNFMEDKGNQLSLATFIGTFVYAITVLRAVRMEDEVPASAQDAAATNLPGFVPQLSLLVGYGLMALSVAVLVYFLNHIPSSIRINMVLEGIGQRLLRNIVKTYPDEGSEDDDRDPPAGEPLLAGKAGYVQLIDFEDMTEFAERHDAKITLAVRTGDFVHKGMAIARLSNVDPADEGIRRELFETLTLGPTRTPDQDPQFLIDELVEIGLRALSPGINDPFTAITAIHWLGAATAEIGRRTLRKAISSKDDEHGPIFPLPDDFEHYLKRGFGAMRSAVASSTNASLVMFDTLRNVGAAIEDQERKARTREQGDRLIAQVRTVLSGPDLAEVEERYASFSKSFWA